jgi:glycosyltransferase involved in cell wall biosynthesis
MPFFSIVVPIYNRADLFLATLSTLQEQDFKDFEIIIIDDGSSDNIKERIGAFTSAHNNIHYFYQKNGERGSARNNGIRRATGKYVVMFDSDDFMHKNHLSTLHAAIFSLGQPAFIATHFDFVNNGQHTSSDIMKLKEGYYDYRLFLHGNPLACNICLKKDNTDLHLFEEDRKYAMLEDWMFLIQNLRHNKLYLVGKVTISQNDHDQRSMKNDNVALIRKAALAHSWILKNVSLSEAEKKVLDAQVNYFSAIHYYLDNNRSKALKHLSAAIKADGLQLKYFSLFAKALAGRSLISSLKG